MSHERQKRRLNRLSEPERRFIMYSPHETPNFDILSGRRNTDCSRSLWPLTFFRLWSMSRSPPASCPFWKLWFFWKFVPNTLCSSRKRNLQARNRADKMRFNKRQWLHPHFIFPGFWASVTLQIMVEVSKVNKNPAKGNRMKAEICLHQYNGVRFG